MIKKRAARPAAARPERMEGFMGASYKRGTVISDDSIYSRYRSRSRTTHGRRGVSLTAIESRLLDKELRGHGGPIGASL
jgi:hypothetical protein